MGRSYILNHPINIARTFYNTHYSKKGYDPLNYRCDLLISTLSVDNNIVLDPFQFRDKSFCGMLIIDEFESTIAYNQSLPPERRNFTIAHELGHYFLHKDHESQFVDNAENMLENTNKVFEQQANAFAAELLIPEDVLNLMLSYRYSYFKIAKITKSSYECLIWRLVNFLNDKLNTSREDSFVIINDYIKHSKTKTQQDSSIFKVLFPGFNKDKISDFIIELRDTEEGDYWEFKKI